MLRAGLDSQKRCDYSSSTIPFYLELAVHRCGEHGRAEFNALFYQWESEVPAFRVQWESRRPKILPGLWSGAGI